MAVGMEPGAYQATPGSQSNQIGPKCSPDLTSLTRWLARVCKSVDPAAGLP